MAYSFTGTGLILEFRFGLRLGYSRMNSFTDSGLILELWFGLRIIYSVMFCTPSPARGSSKSAGLDYTWDIHDSRLILEWQAWPSHRTFRDLGTTHWIFREGLFHRPFRLWTPFFNLEFRLGLCCGSGLILNLRHVFCIRSVLLNLHRIYEQ